MPLIFSNKFVSSIPYWQLQQLNYMQRLQLMAAIDRLYPPFTQSLLERCPEICPDKMHIACLIKTGMDKTSIRNITE